MDETGVFFKDTTRKTFHIKGEDCPGGKRSKESMTINHLTLLILVYLNLLQILMPFLSIKVL
jgi:hypothetical protein